jgi:glyoxylase-like metal-dependent hydrolase (beta-lactamase superfamily II)
MAAEEVAPGVWAVDQSVVEGKNGVVVGDRRAVAIDTGNNLADGQALVDVLRAAGHGPDRLILTHGHGDHVRGSTHFKRGEVFAHHLAPAEVRRHLPDVDAVADSLAWPTVLFDGALRLDLGGKTLRLFPTPGHSVDGICVYVEPHRVLFGGDVVVTGIVPAIFHDAREMERSLARLLELDVDVLVPGHGPVVRGRDAAREAIAWQLGYLRGVRAAIAGGASPEDVVFERHVGARLPPDRWGMLKRHQNTVAKIADEETRTR